MKRARVATRGFTLLELLVVISIIALLMGLLLPSLRAAREQSRQVVCRKNLHNIWRGVVVYAVENNDRAPYIERLEASYDPFDPQYPTLVGNVLGPYVERWSFVCPSAVAGYPETDPESRRRWKMTYEFSTPNGPSAKSNGGAPYDDAEGAYTSGETDPAIINQYHFDGRPFRMIVNPPRPAPAQPNSVASVGEDEGNVKAEIIWTSTVPLVSDTLTEEKPGELAAGRPRYPHRGVVRRQADFYRSAVGNADPRLISSKRPGYFHLTANRENANVFLTRVSPDNDPDN